MLHDELAQHLQSLKRDDCYRVEEVLKSTPYETTQKVYFVGANGAEQGPYVRKYLDRDRGFGNIYELVFAAQKTGRRFHHMPHIHDVYHIGEECVVVMEYVVGTTLQDVVYRVDPSYNLAVDLFPRLCDAVLELHRSFEQPIIHRDLKPSNVMVTRDNIVIIDFGIARMYQESASDDTHHFGTRSYAPPEQFGFGQTDERSDVYALGALLYYCLTEKTIDNAVKQNGYVSPEIPENLREILRKSTAFDPVMRYASVEELKRVFLVTTGGAAVHEGIPSYIGKGDTFYEQEQSRPKNFLSRIPFPLGVVWDVLLFLIFVFFMYIALALPFESSGQFDSSLRIFQNLCIVLLIITPALYLVSDRRPIRRIFPLARRLNWTKDLLIALISFVLCFIIVGVYGALFPQ